MATTNGTVTTYYPEEFRRMAVKLAHHTLCPSCQQPMRYQDYKILVGSSTRLQASACCVRQHEGGIGFVYANPTITL